MLDNIGKARKIFIVFVTAPNLKTARQLSRAALTAKLAACANLIPAVESHYWWQGKLERSSEILLLFKTTRPRLKKLEALVLAKHPYDTPEFIALPIHSGNEKYLTWLSRSCS